MEPEFVSGWVINLWLEVVCAGLRWFEVVGEAWSWCVARSICCTSPLGPSRPRSPMSHRGGRDLKRVFHPRLRPAQPRWRARRFFVASTPGKTLWLGFKGVTKVGRFPQFRVRFWEQSMDQFKHGLHVGRFTECIDAACWARDSITMTTIRCSSLFGKCDQRISKVSEKPPATNPNTQTGSSGLNHAIGPAKPKQTPPPSMGLSQNGGHMLEGPVSFSS